MNEYLDERDTPLPRTVNGSSDIVLWELCEVH